MEQKFLDNLDGWGDAIIDTYNEANDKHLFLKIHTLTEDNKLFSDDFGFKNVEVDGELSFYIREENIHKILSKHTYAYEYFTEDDIIRMEIPINLVDIYLDGKPLKVKLSLEPKILNIELNKNNEIDYYRLFDLTYGLSYAIVDYQADCRYFVYKENQLDKNLESFIIEFNKDLFKNYDI